jgi:L-rhamnose mutarotase
MKKRYAFLMRVKPELKAEYKKTHNEIWPDMAKAFAWLGKTKVNERWQTAMDRYFVKKDPSILGPEVIPLEEVFHIE